MLRTARFVSSIERSLEQIDIHGEFQVYRKIVGLCDGIQQVYISFTALYVHIRIQVTIVW